MNVMLTITKNNAKRRVVEKRDPIQSRSFVKAYLQFLYCSMSNLSQNVVDTSNVSRAVPAGIDPFISTLHPGLEAGAESQNVTDGNGILYRVLGQYADDVGIVVGTSNTAVAVADENLVSQVAHGTGAGQLTHYGSYGLNYTTGASSASFDLEREFRNDSGGSIIIAEIGIYVVSSLNSGSTGYSFCILRDVLGATVTVNNGEYLKVKYTITVSN